MNIDYYKKRLNMERITGDEYVFSRGTDGYLIGKLEEIQEEKLSDGQRLEVVEVKEGSAVVVWISDPCNHDSEFKIFNASPGDVIYAIRR